MSHTEIELTNKGEVVLEIFEGPDTHGRYSFLKYTWFEGYHLGPTWFRQAFLRDLQYDLEKAVAAGLEVRTIDRRRSPASLAWVQREVSRLKQRPRRGAGLGREAGGGSPGRGLE